LRKINIGVGLLVPGICVVLAGYAKDNAALDMALAITMIGFTYLTVRGCMIRCRQAPTLFFNYDVHILSVTV